MIYKEQTLIFHRASIHPSPLADWCAHPLASIPCMHKNIPITHHYPTHNPLQLVMATIPLAIASTPM